MGPIQLITDGGNLYYPPNPDREWMPKDRLILLVRYTEGDCDTIRWPNPNRSHLRTCLMDDRECGMIQAGQDVLLPDGTSAYAY